MNVQKSTKQSGFTIIEVVLVLAIAGLIMLMIFIALPALQRGQRDTARKNDVGVIVSAVTSYVSNNRGTFPTTANIGSYVTNLSDNTPTVNVSTTTGAQVITSADGTATVTQSSRCGAADATVGKYDITAGTSRQFTVVTKLESGNGVAFCQEG